MNKLRLLIPTLAIILGTFVAIPTAVTAHGGHDDNTQSHSDATPTTMPETPQTSDSTEENEQPAESTKGVFEKYPIPSVVVGVAVVGCVGFLAYKIVKKNK